MTVVDATSSAARPISEEEEYYVGRAVSAKILGSYQMSTDAYLTRYVNLIGKTVALNSDKPFTFGGYHFAVLDTDEINAFAAPGGTIFITRGMIRTTSNEDELGRSSCARGRACQQTRRHRRNKERTLDPGGSR